MRLLDLVNHGDAGGLFGRVETRIVAILIQGGVHGDATNDKARRIVRRGCGGDARVVVKVGGTDCQETPKAGPETQTAVASSWGRRPSLPHAAVHRLVESKREAVVQACIQGYDKRFRSGNLAKFLANCSIARPTVPSILSRGRLGRNWPGRRKCEAAVFAFARKPFDPHIDEIDPNEEQRVPKHPQLD